MEPHQYCSLLIAFTIFAESLPEFDAKHHLFFHFVIIFAHFLFYFFQLFNLFQLHLISLPLL